MKSCTKGQLQQPCQLELHHQGKDPLVGLETLPSSMEAAEIPHTANQTSPIARERQLSERPCVAEVSFCQTKVSEQSLSWLKAPLLQFPAA